MENNKNSRDGSFVVIYRYNEKGEIEFFLGCNIEDNLFELLGGGFDLSDFTPNIGAIREVCEETSGKILISQSELIYFAHMIQKLPKLGEGEKGSVFCFFYETSCMLKYVESSHEHSYVSWHKLSDLLLEGERFYRTSTLRIIFHFLNYLDDRKFRFGVLGDKVKFMKNEI